MSSAPLAPPAPILWIGFGEMGRPMAARLAAAGWSVRAVDRDPDRLLAAQQLGITPAGTACPALPEEDVVALSLPSADALAAVATPLVASARPGQVFVDFGTTLVADTRRLAATAAAAGACWVDAPVSGGPGGAESGRLRIFVGGEPGPVSRVAALLACVGGVGGEPVTHCGGPGSGQLAKGVNQLAMGLHQAACVEAVAFGVLAGLPAETIAAAVGSDHGWRRDIRETASAIAQGRGDNLGVKFRELPYFLDEARRCGFDLPITAEVRRRLEDAPRTVVDDHRPAPSWYGTLRSQRPA